MRELATNVYESLGNAVEELEKDIELNPKRFLGIPLYPENLWSWFSVIATIGFGLLQQQLQ